MNVTNQYGAPEQFVRAIQNDGYTKGDADFSATGLIRPPQISRLEAEHEDKLSTDVADSLFALLGTGVHAVLEGHAPEEALVEQRWFAEMDGYVVSGAIDLYHEGHVTDYKVTGTYSTMVGKPEWEQQLNIYAWLLRQNDMPVESLTICAVCRDWSARKKNPHPKKSNRKYPDSPIVQIDIPIWLPRRAEDFVRQRVELHSSESVVPCSDEERWKRGPSYIRCETYCSVSDFCPQYNDQLIISERR
tara:strand:+ start:1409 stop:2146 length:738 start_codon:yes stop_codon:yes gene_type:complete